jgi:hypothetical protein
MNLHDLFNEVKGIPPRPWELSPLEGGGMGGGSGSTSSGRSPFGGSSLPSNVPGGNLARDIATGRNVGGEAIPSLGQSGKVVTNKTVDNALTKLGGKSTEVTPGPKVTPGSSSANVPLDVEVPAYIRQGKSDPVTTPKPGTKPTIKMQPGETMDQAIQRTRAEQEFSNFLKGQGGQTFGTAGGGRGGQGGPTAAQATSDSGQVPTIRLPNGKLIVDTNRIGPNGQIIPPESEMDKIIQKWNQEQPSPLIKSQYPWGGDIDKQPSWAKSGSDNPSKPSRLSQWLGYDVNAGKNSVDEASHKEPEVDYDDEYDAMVARVRKLAGLGPMKTVYDPNKRQYRNVPTAQQPKVQPKK